MKLCSLSGAVATCCSASILFLSGAASAEEGQETAKEEHQTAIAIDPQHLIVPILELAVERSLPQDFSVAASAGIGLVSQRVWQVGVQGRYYALGDFNHGMPIIGEALYLRDDRDELDVSVLRASLMVGYKLALRSGFTISIAAGVGVPVIARSLYARHTRVGVVLDTGIGWSF